MILINKPIKILYFDIETTPMSVWTHYIGRKVSVNPCQIEKRSKIICICYKYSDEKKVHSLRWNAKNQCDIAMLKKFNKIAAKADLLLGHNGQNFDVKEIRTAMALRDIKEAWCETPCLDTLKDFRRVFRFKSNRLDAIAQELGLGHKDPMVFQDWINTVKGSKKALEKMVKYCKKDVILLEKIHKRLDYHVPPTIKENNLKKLKQSTILTKVGCKTENCNSKEFIKYGTYKYRGEVHQRYLCKSCYVVNMPTKDNR
jgi:uncharacterized protein YprB with RNaseH-like and TPR domain